MTNSAPKYKQAQAAVDQPDEAIMRDILSAIDENADISQRQLASSLGIALGSVNWYLKRCINKGLVKISQAPLKRYLYYLTPQGFEEKSRLTTNYLKDSFSLFRLGRTESKEILENCKNHGWSKIVLAGESDVAEIFILSAHEIGIEISSIYDPESSHIQLCGVPIETTLEDDVTAVILTDLRNPVQSYERIQGRNILIPRILNFQPQKEGQ